MPIYTIIPLSAIVAVFAFFAAVLMFGDATWSRPAKAVRHGKTTGNRR